MTEFEKVDAVLRKFEKRQSHIITKQEWDELSHLVTGSDSNHSSFLSYKTFLLSDSMIEKIPNCEGELEYGITIKGRLKLMNGGYLNEHKNYIQQSIRAEKLENAQKFHQCMMTTLTVILAFVGLVTVCIMAIDVYLDHSFWKILGF